MNTEMMYKNAKRTRLLTWTTLQDAPSVTKREVLRTKNTIEAVDALANKSTGVYRDRTTQEFVFVVWYYDMPFEVARLVRDTWYDLSSWTEEITGLTAAAFGISDIFSLCGVEKKKWEIVRDTIYSAINEKDTSSMPKWH